LTRTLRDEELFVVYQPIVDLKTGDCIGIEALVRWEHPTLGTLLPDEFIPIAEDANVMLLLGSWVMRRVCADFKKFDSKMLLFVSVNITANELTEEKTAQDILGAIDEFGVDINKVVLELTETSFMKKPEALIQKLSELSDIHVKIAIDDYGTGYSSLSYLKRLPISILKVDKSFIDDMNKSPNDTIILESTLELAHKLKLSVIAEGIETKEQYDFLKKTTCDYVQGFYLSKPLKLEDVIKFKFKEPKKH
jgi:diguanylate cyclase